MFALCLLLCIQKALLKNTAGYVIFIFVCLFFFFFEKQNIKILKTN